MTEATALVEVRGIQVGDLTVRPGDTKIHTHPQAEQIVEHLVVWVRQPPEKRVSLPRLEQIVDAMFPGLELKGDGQYLRRWIREYGVMEAAVPSKERILEALLDKAVELNLPVRRLEVIERTYRKFLAVSRDPEAKPKDVALLAGTLDKLLSSGMEDGERFGTVPGKVTRSVSMEFKAKDVDVDRFARTLHGRRRVVDVEAAIKQSVNGGDASGSHHEAEDAEEDPVSR